MKSISRLIVALLLAASTGCGSGGKPRADVARPACDIAVLRDYPMFESAQSKCELQAIANRCNKGDACFIACWKDRWTEKNSAGGCHHLCKESGGKPWQPPANTCPVQPGN